MKTVEAMQVIQLLERCEGLGANPAALRESAGLTPAQLADPDERLPWDAFLRIFAAAARETRDPLVALRAGLLRRPRGLLIYQFRAQESLKDALAQLEHSARLAADPFGLEVREGTREAWVCLLVDDPESDALCMVREYEMGFMLGFLAEVLRPFRPHQIRFPHMPRGSLAEYERLLGAAVRFRQRDCAIAIAPDLLAAPLATANKVVAQMLGEQIERRLAVRREGEFRARVERAMEERLREGRAVGRQPVAHRLGVSVRTLQRRLGAEGVTFRAVREAVLQRAATALLARPSLSLVEVARQLGFADEDAFAKAWKRWTGETPRAQRGRP